MKKILSIFLILLLCISNHPIYANELDITSDYVLLYNLNDKEIIYEMNSDSQVNIASLTKMMTALVAIENCNDLNEKVKIEKKHFKNLDGYSKAGFKVGDIVSVKDLLYGILLPSGADACNAIAYHIGNNMNNFIQLMNQKAQELNLTHTHFDNPIGMDSEENYSTAKDLSVLLEYALSNPVFKDIFCTRTYKIEELDLQLNSTLIGYSKNYDIDTDIILGSKTGYTSEAGYCLASIANINDVDYLLIVLNADTDLKCNAVLDSINIYNYFSQNYGYHTIINKNELLYQLPIKWGIEKEYSIYCDEDIITYIENNYNKEDIVIEYEGINELNYQIKKNDLLGSIKIIYKDKIIKDLDIYLDEDIFYIDPIFISISIIISIIILYKLLNKKRVSSI